MPGCAANSAAMAAPGSASARPAVINASRASRQGGFDASVARAASDGTAAASGSSIGSTAGVSSRNRSDDDGGRVGSLLLPTAGTSSASVRATTPRSSPRSSGISKRDPISIPTNTTTATTVHRVAKRAGNRFFGIFIFWLLSAELGSLASLLTGQSRAAPRTR